jgi:hypothetical protein
MGGLPAGLPHDPGRGRRPGMRVNARPAEDHRMRHGMVACALDTMPHPQSRAFSGMQRQLEPAASLSAGSAGLYELAPFYATTLPRPRAPRLTSHWRARAGAQAAARRRCARPRWPPARASPPQRQAA